MQEAKGGRSIEMISENGTRRFFALSLIFLIFLHASASLQNQIIPRKYSV